MSDASSANTVVQALAALRELKAKHEASERAKTEPIAVVGLACRFPAGADDAEAFWDLLARGGDASGEVPPDRFDVGAFYSPDPEAAGAISTRRGSFLRDVSRFDAGFFGLSPREAECLDPQQRLLLEVAWDALEDAGLPADALAGTRTGVFVGMMNTDYFRMMLAEPAAIDTYSGAGGIYSTASGRLSYLFDFKGPSLVVDTACSSSLVALHLACQSLRAGESDVALVGGVNALLSPDMFVTCTRMRLLSADGRCKTFDARGDGYGRGEGCGVVVLKRLSDAEAAGDRILAVVRGSAVNQDGASAGLTAPNFLAQRAVIREALASARVAPEQVGYVEAHGTGTALGDPIEVEALRQVLGEAGPASAPCWLGSVKANIGHLEGAAGVSALIKVVLSLRHGQIPPHPTLGEVNPNIDLSGSRLRIVREAVPWPAGAPRIAGVSSFGISGTNAHVVVEAYQPGAVAEGPAEVPGASAGPPVLLPLSARSPEALGAVADAWCRWIAGRPAADLPAIARAAARRRAHHDHRLAVVGATPAELADRLAAFTADEARPGLVAGRRNGDRAPRIAFVCSGQGPQWHAMGRQLLAEDPGFAQALDGVDAVVRPLAGFSVREELGRDEAQSRLGATEVAQPAIFALQVALARWLKARGVRADALVGHSVGEVAAAHLAGVLPLDAAVRVVVERGRLMQRTSGHGRMAAVEGDAAAVRAVVAQVAGVEVAAVNAPDALTLAGDAGPLDEAVARLTAEGLVARALKVDYAFHSAHVEPLRAELEEALAGLAPQPPRVALRSSLTGQPAQPGDFDAAYWSRQMRQPVAFREAVEGLLDDGIDLFVELSPHPVLAAAIGSCARARGATATVVPTLVRKADERLSLLAAVAEVHVHGGAIAWEALDPAPAAPYPLPPYPWQRRRFWFPAATGGPARRAGGHPLLGPEVRPAHQPGTRIHTTHLAPARLPYLADHAFQGRPVVPASALAELVRAAVAPAGGPVTLEALQLERLLPVPDEGEVALQLVLDAPADGGAAFRLFAAEGDAWHPAAMGRWREGASPAASWPEVPLAEEALDARFGPGRAGSAFQAEAAARGLAYGPAFRGVVRTWRGEGLAIARLAASEAVLRQAPAYGLHPALLDAGLQAALAGLPDGPETFVLTGWEALAYAASGVPAWSVARTELSGADRATADVRLFDADGRVLVEVRALALQRVARVEAAPAAAEAAGAPVGFAAELAAADPAGRKRLLTAHVQEQAARILKTSPADVSPTAALSTQGVDSLMAVELRNRLERSLGLTLPATLAWSYPTVEALAVHLAAALAPADGPRHAGVPAVAEDALKAQVEALSDAEAEAQLLDSLAGFLD